MNYIKSNNAVIANNKIYIDGQYITDFPQGNSNNITMINNHIFINGYELINGKWKKTLRALWHKYF